ncbi:hypothetical protein IWW34DRAFT_799884 [Fusarium oxysporum f. sp. albedinis]|nr:hypothetical protein IWW34DRAFT_799884 [Fusarium oxysporum f. sp. albedinis]
MHNWAVDLMPERAVGSCVDVKSRSSLVAVSGCHSDVGARDHERGHSAKEYQTSLNNSICNNKDFARIWQTRVKPITEECYVSLPVLAPFATWIFRTPKLINHIRRPTGKYAFVRCIDNRPIPISVGILLDPDCKRRPKTTDRGSVTEKFVKISFLFLIRQWAETRLLNGHCPKLKSAESINQTRKAKFDGPGLGGTTADFAKIEPAVGTKASAQVQYAREDGDNWVDSILDPMLHIMAARSDVVALTASVLGFQTRLLLAS